MSKSAGTLITTNNATYIPPRFMPGYRGHVPTMKFDYGETYGNHTVKYFQDFRSDALNTSKTNYCRGGYFPTFYSYNPDMAVGQRTRQWDRWLQEPRYTVTPHDHDRKEELIRFDRQSKAHREHYTDKSGTAQRVDYFMLPTKAQDQFKKQLPFLVMSTRYTDDINLGSSSRQARQSSAGEPTTGGGKVRSPASSASSPLPPTSSQRDREMRDVYFERR